MADNVTLPASGSVIATDQLGTGEHVQIIKVMDGTLDSSNKLIISASGAAKVDGSAVTQPVSASSLPLPSGAATSAKQPALGTAGSASADVVSIQGVASMTAVKVDGSATTQPISGTITANAGTGTFNIQSNASINNAQVSGTAVDVNSGNKSAGTQRIVIATDQPQLTNALKVDGSGVTQPVSGTVTANIGTSGSLALDASVAGLSLAQASTTSGQKGALVQGAVTTAAPSYTTAQTSPLSLTTAGAVRVDASATTQPVSGTVTANAGTGTWAANISQFGGSAVATGTGASGAGVPRVTVANDSNILATQSGTWTVQPGNTANTTAWLTTAVPTTSGGLSTTKLISAATTNATSVKASAGQVYNIQAFNLNAAARYLKLYNKASAPTVGTDTPINVWLIPPSSSGFIIEISNGIACATGIAFALTTGITDADTGALAANEILVNMQYK